ncbi:uncharacterized protein [Porites lutea]|uniref:uncharacterized protein n=1 Tax=Porites lutea TaxID=51062 RepID=UPI003CC63D7A
MLVSALLVVLLPRFSLEAPVNKREVSARTKDVLLSMYHVCISKPKLMDLTRETKEAYAKEHFGDPLESRQVDINGIEPLSNSKERTVQLVVSKAFKQLSIFHALFEDLLGHLNQTNEKHNIVNKTEAMKKKMKELERLATIAANFEFDKSLAYSTSSSVATSLKQQKAVWTKSAFRQKTWILGVLREFDICLRYLQPAFLEFSSFS